ncbi:MAG: hypothetical protein AAFN10_04455 [Bacteroidota bacterium]
MQKFLACLSAAIFFSVLSLDAQISLDPAAASTQSREISPIHLQHSGSKYLDLSELDRQQVKILDQDGKLFRSLRLPADPPHTLSKQISAVSENLFDRDPSTIEFIVVYKRDFIAEDGSRHYTQDYYVMNEAGEEIFHQPETAFVPSGPAGDYIWSMPAGAKLCVMDLNPASPDYQEVYFYSLPGTLSQGDKTEVSNTGKLNIDWTHLREAPQTVAEIRLFMLDGRLAYVIQVGPADMNLKNHDSQYPKGTYTYQLLSREGYIIQAKRTVKVW